LGCLPAHFEFTFSGANLSDEQKLRISNEIATAVAKGVVGDAPQLLGAPMWSACRINGGKWYVGAVAGEILKLVENSQDKSLTAGLNPGGRAV
jgi:tRNA U55 pseudouridine synthase TruB